MLCPLILIGLLMLIESLILVDPQISIGMLIDSLILIDLLILNDPLKLGHTDPLMENLILLQHVLIFYWADQLIILMTAVVCCQLQWERMLIRYCVIYSHDEIFKTTNNSVSLINKKYHTLNCC